MDEETIEAERPGDRALDSLLADSMIAAALAAHGLRSDALPWEPEEYSTMDAVRCAAVGGSPALIIDTTGEGNLWWHDLAGHSFSYDIGRPGRTLTIGRIDLPSTTLTALSGKSLDVVVDLPRARDLTIAQAETILIPVGVTQRTGVLITIGKSVP